MSYVYKGRYNNQNMQTFFNKCLDYNIEHENGDAQAPLPPPLSETTILIYDSIVSELPLLPSRQEVISRTSNAFHKSINKVNDNHNILKQYLERIT